MKLSKEIIGILKNFSTINPSIMLKPGNFIMTKSINGVSYAEATVTDEITDTLSILELGAFLNIHSQLGEDSEVATNEAGDITISNKRSKVTMLSSDSSIIVHPAKRLVFPVANVIFELSMPDYKDIIKVSRLVNADHISITTRDGRLVIDALSLVSGSDMPRYSLDICEYEGENKFEFRVHLNNLKMVESDYKVMISAKGAIKFEGAQATYVVVLENSSTHDFK